MSNDDQKPGVTPEEPVGPVPGGDAHDALIERDPIETLPEAGPGTAPVGSSAEAFGRGEGVGSSKEVEGLSQGQIVWGRFVRHRGAMGGVVMLVLIALLSITSMGIFGIPGWWRIQDYNASGEVVNGAAPSLSWLPFSLGAHPFGQDDIGRDNFALVMKGIQTSLMVMIVLGIIALVIGVTIGALAGYYRGRTDTFLMRFTDLIITLPVIVMGAVLGKLINTLPDKMNWSYEFTQAIRDNIPLLLAIMLGLVLWTGLARLVRSEFLTLREREFVDAARVAGASDWRIISKHILPNAVGVIIVNTTLMMSAAVVLEAALSFLGFGVKAPNVSLGMLISQYQGAFATRPWLFWWPGLFIILIALSINFIGDGLRDAFDPRTKKIPSQRQMDKAMAEIATASATGEAAK